MSTNEALPATVLQRKAVVYVRQSTPQQVQANLESQRRQYELVEVARRRGFSDAEMQLAQARYDASLAERRYAACDPDNRLIAAQLEKTWEAALQRVEACRQ